MKLWLYRSSLFFLLLIPSRDAWSGERVLPSFREVRDSYRSSEGKLLDREGRLLQERRISWNGRVLDWVELPWISSAMQEAVLAVEDRRFLEHGGVDIQAVAGALWQNLSGRSHRGASTISMQTVSLIEESGAPPRGRRSLWSKVRQARLAWELERDWSKAQILEAYLNLVSFRGEHKGIAAASRALFAKDPHGLDLRESYLLATLLRSPGMSASAAVSRLCRQAKEVSSLGSCEALTEFVQLVLNHSPAVRIRSQLAPHLARHLLTAERSEVRSTISLPLQMAALQAVQDQLKSLHTQNVQDAAVIVVKNRTGEVLAYVGGSGNFSASPEVDMAQAFRQAGSTLKPFLYGLAFEKGYLEPDSWLLDEPFELALERGSYEPENYDHRFHGPVAAKIALASSLNIPAVRVLSLTGVEAFQELLTNLGFRDLQEGAHYGPSLALGTADVSLVDLVQAYMTVANGGVWRQLRFRMDDPISKGKHVLGKKVTGELAAILSDRSFRSLTFGWDSLLATRYPAAVKTGTSKDMRDNWCVGFSREFTVGVWVGNASGAPMWQVSGVSGAAPIWRSLMDRLHKGKSAQEFLSLLAKERDFERGRFGRILYPASGTVLALDPDIPESRQRMEMETEGEGILILDGQALTDSTWKLVKGGHLLRLLDPLGSVLDEVTFEVR